MIGDHFGGDVGGHRGSILPLFQRAFAGERPITFIPTYDRLVADPGI
jgi:hypothetical protein